MTTVILTVMSIMLAALAALMIVFYGGGMFHDGAVSAEADTYMNAAHNVIAAADQFRMDNRYDPPDVTSLVDSGYLKAFPYRSRSILSQSGTVNRLSIEGVDPRVCARINETLKRPEAEWLDPSANANDGSGSMGCQLSAGTGTFYAIT